MPGIVHWQVSFVGQIEESILKKIPTSKIIQHHQHQHQHQHQHAPRKKAGHSSEEQIQNLKMEVSAKTNFLPMELAYPGMSCELQTAWEQAHYSKKFYSRAPVVSYGSINSKWTSHGFPFRQNPCLLSDDFMRFPLNGKFSIPINGSVWSCCEPKPLYFHPHSDKWWHRGPKKT